MSDQLNIFEVIKPRFKISKPIRLIELFAGVGSQAMALRNLGANFEHYKVVEFDKYAIASYNAIHGTNFPMKDITQVHASDLEIVDTDKYCYIITYSFPCQDLSKAGKGKGMSKGSGTRSGLLWEVERILTELMELVDKENLELVLLMENVPDVIGTKNIKDFNEWQHRLEQLGFSSYVDCLNAKNYGIPQNRNRCFMVSVFGDYYYGFPKSIPLELKLKDLLTDTVDKKYYIEDYKKLSKINDEYSMLQGGKWDKIHDCAKRVYETNGCSPTVNTCQGGNLEPKIVTEPVCINPKGGRNGIDNLQPSIQDRIYDSNAISPAVTTCYHPNIKIDIEDGIPISEATEKGYSLAKDGDYVNLQFPDSKTRRGRVGKEVAQTLLCNDSNGVVEKVDDSPRYRIRKLTPLECWRLMGFSDEDFNKAAKVNSNSQLYKQAGNSIVVNVLMAIFKQML